MRPAIAACLLVLGAAACDRAEPVADAPAAVPALPGAPEARPQGEQSPRGPRGPQDKAAFMARIERGFSGLDADGDGVVTATELEGASGGRAAPMLARLDADGDGRVTRDEMAAGAERMFARMDANGDGVVTPDERPGRGMGRGGEGRGGPPN